MRKPVTIRHRFGDEPKRSQARLSGISASGRMRGMCEAGNRQAVPVGEHLVIAAGLRPLVAPTEKLLPHRPQCLFLGFAEPLPRRGREAV